MRVSRSLERCALPDRLRPTPPTSQALVSVEPVRLAVHEPFPVPWNHRLERFRDPEREDALAEQHGPDKLRLDDTFQGGRSFHGFLSLFR